MKLVKVSKGEHQQLRKASMRTAKVDGCLRLKIETYDCRMNDFYLEVPPSELIELALKAAEVVNNNNSNCPSKLVLKWT